MTMIWGRGKVLSAALALLMSGVELSAQTLVRIDKNRMTLSLIQDSVEVMCVPISCGRGFGPKQRENDMRTPEGIYKVVSFTDSRSWGHDFKDGLGYIKQAYGPWFIRLSSGNGIGIHGTHAPESMGLRASEGCIRLRNEDLLELKPKLRRGTVVEIVPDSFPLIQMPVVSNLLLPLPKAKVLEKSNID